MERKETITRCLQMLAANCHFEMDELSYEAYLMALDRLPTEKMMPATHKLMRTATFMPRPAEIYKAAGVDPERPDVAPHIRTKQMLERMHATPPGQQRYIPEEKPKTINKADNHKADRETEKANRRRLRAVLKGLP